MAAFVSFGANASDGQVEFKGSVVESACSIAPEYSDQSIDFGKISKGHLTNGGISEMKPFEIQLLHCDTTALQNGVTVTFSGQPVDSSAPTEFATNGTTNTAVVISAYGKNVEVNNPTAAIKLGKGENTLHFTSWVKAANGKTVAEGDFNLISNFTLDYK